MFLFGRNEDEKAQEKKTGVIASFRGHRGHDFQD
jgi:hypothetical protein